MSRFNGICSKNGNFEQIKEYLSKMPIFEKERKMKPPLIKLPKKESLAHSDIQKELILAHRQLAELKGIAHTIPNEKILLLNLTLQEAKDSSAIENIITTQDSMYKHKIQSDLTNTANKEIYGYSSALEVCCRKAKKENGISLNTILKIQKFIEPEKKGFRKVPGTVLKNTKTGQITYTPPSPEKIPELMSRLEDFMNANSMDPLIKMAVIHHWFESIHPFYDGNGRTGRIINILYLVVQNLLDSPILYLSRYILKNRSDYYKLLQHVRETEEWEDWILYMLKGISIISQDTIKLIRQMDELFKKFKNIIRKNYKFYSHELINNIFMHPYTKVRFLEEDMKVSRATAARYLDALSESEILKKEKLGKESYYINTQLFDLLKDS